MRCPANHSLKRLKLLPASLLLLLLLLLLSIWLSALMMARLQRTTVWGPIVSRETEDNGWIIKRSPVERKWFFFQTFATAHTTYFYIFFTSSFFPPIYIHFSYILCFFFFALIITPACDMQMGENTVGLMLINTVQTFIWGSDRWAKKRDRNYLRCMLLRVFVQRITVQTHRQTYCTTCTSEIMLQLSWQGNKRSYN